MRIPAVFAACLLALQPFLAVAQTYTWTTFAGRPPQFGSADGDSADARFYNPNSLAADASGNLFVTDTFNHTVRRISRDGVVTTVAGSVRVSGTADGTGTAARFSSPNGIALDASGNLYVADRGNHSIRKVTPAGVVTTLAGLTGTAGATDGKGAAARFSSPSGVAVDATGNVWVSDTLNHAVRRIAADGTVTTIAGTLGAAGPTDDVGPAARFSQPLGLAFDPGGALIVADSANHTIRRIDVATAAVTTVAGFAGASGSTSATGTAARFNFPAGLAIDATGVIYVADSANDCIRRITTAGVVSVFAGGADVRGSANGTGTAARFYSPFGLALAGDGGLFVSDTLNHTIRRITPAQAVTNYAGPGGGFGSANGTGPEARFNFPQGLSVDADNNLYVADWRNAMIRRITPAGVVTNFQAFTSAYSVAWGGGLLVSSDRVTHVVRVFPLTTTGFVDLGAAGQSGSTDGVYTGARFNQPHGVSIDLLGRILIADTGNHTIRLVGTVPGTGLTVATVVGSAGVSGAANGAATTVARLSSPRGVTTDLAGNLYITDTGSHTIRKVSPAGVVSTLAGAAFTSGTAGGPGSAARFNSPEGITVDTAGNLYVADRFNHAVRRIAPDGFVTTIGGLPSFPGYAEGTGTTARFYEPTGIVMDLTGTLYVTSAANNIVMRGVLDRTPTITTQPQSTAVVIGGQLTLSVVGTGGGLSYQWKLDGTPIPGATSATYTRSNAQPADSGRYTVDVINSAGATTSAVAVVSVQATVELSRIVNLAIRSQAGADDRTLIVGIGIGGSGTLGNKSILIRGIGPTLGAFGVAGVLPDPRLELFSGSIKVNENDNWSGDPQVAEVANRVGAFALTSPASRDAALYLPSLAGGSYSVKVSGGTGGGGATTGVALAEIYDATPAGSVTASTPRLTNVSARTQVGTEGDILIAGFVIAGQTPKTVLIRAIGPTLGSFGVGGALADPKLELFGDAGKLRENDNWGGDAQLSSTFFAVGAFPLTATSRDAVLLVTLSPGSY
ncbi:MAG: hypothetical protein NTV51_18890, partial [Verrucomicrobia bacterium]|nr:hypothetical protein [Verrucomicrobiota bacterium]